MKLICRIVFPFVFLFFSISMLSADARAGIVLKLREPPEYVKRVVAHDKVNDWYLDFGEILFATADEEPYLLETELIIAYDKGNRDAETEIIQRIVEIKSFLRTYFSSKPLKAYSPLNEEELKNEITDSINKNVLKCALINDVRFLYFGLSDAKIE